MHNVVMCCIVLVSSDCLHRLGFMHRQHRLAAGATNRVDALDAALRRPGRFDRELVFPLPSLAARASILDIHTCHWADPPSAQLRAHLAQLSVGYCGADLKVRYPSSQSAAQGGPLEPLQQHADMALLCRTMGSQPGQACPAPSSGRHWPGSVWATAVEAAQLAVP